MRGLLAATLIVSAAPSVAETPFLALPLDCILGQTCFVEDYFDSDPGPDARDYTCGFRTRDGHRGVDFALTGHAALDQGVTVLAAAPGIVEAIRDGMSDRAYTPEIDNEIKGRECGNAVRIRHENGLQTLYCHLKRDSVLVSNGDNVTSGTPLGLVGMSGLTNYPHLHISVLRDGQYVDPFSPQNPQSCEDIDSTQLFLPAIPYEKTGFFTAAFTDHVPTLDSVRDATARRDRLATLDPLVFYLRFHHAQPGDVLDMWANGPDGEVFQQTVTLEDTQRDMFRAFGRRAPQAGWATGTYRGYGRLMRGDTLIAVRHADVVIE